MSSSSLIVSTLESNPISKELILQATRHVSPTKKKNLFSSVPLIRGNAIGYLYESIVYEIIVRITQESDEFSRFILRRGDVPGKFLAIRPSLGQNGFFYSSSGELTVRGDGIDLGEIDSMLFDRQRNVLCAEAMVSKNNLGGLVKEIRYKKHLLSLLFERTSEFVIASPEDVAHTSAGRQLTQEGGCYFARTAPFEELLSKLSLSEIQSYHPKPSNVGKGILARHIPVTKTFSYRRIHNERRASLINALASNASGELIEQSVAEPLLARIVVGQLDREAVRELTDSWSFTIGGSRIKPDAIRGRAHRVILVLGLPEMRPGLYFKSERPVAFAKFGPFKKDEFGCERVIFPWSTPYFFSLDSNRDIVSPLMMKSVMKNCLTAKVIGPNVKKRRPEERAVIRNLFNMPW